MTTASWSGITSANWCIFSDTPRGGVAVGSACSTLGALLGRVVTVVACLRPGPSTSCLRVPGRRGWGISVG